MEKPPILKKTDQNIWEIYLSPGNKIATIKKKRPITGFGAKAKMEYFVYFTEDPKESGCFCTNPKVVERLLRDKLEIDVQFTGE